MNTVRTNCPRDCYDGCGIVVETETGKRPRVLGDPDHPISRGKLCSKCAVSYNGVWQDPDVRLKAPMKRTGPKGSGRFEAISWEEAMDTVGSRLGEIVAGHGGESILGVHYTGNISLMSYFFPCRLMGRLGASMVDYGTICNAAGFTAWDLLFGSALNGFDPRSARDSACLLLWGVNPSHTAPHIHEHWLGRSPAKVVVVDPVRTETAARADLHLQPRPGSDAALAFGLLHALRERGRFDHGFIEAHTLGADEISATIDACTPAWAEAQTGVSARDIGTAAEYYGAGPAFLWAGQALQRQPQGGNVMRAAGLLPAFTGNIGKPGAGFYYVNDAPEVAGVDYDYLVAAQLAGRKGKTVGALELADRLIDRDEFRAFMVWNCNPLASCSDQLKLRQACSREDLFTVVIDCFETDSALYADVVLPAASFLEYNDITSCYFSLLIGAQSRALEPVGESLSNMEIFRRIARAMDLDDAPLYESDEEIIANLLAQMNAGCDFSELQAMGHYYLNGQEPILFFSDLEFPTPSGRIEIASSRAEEMGLPRIPHPGVDPLPSDGRLRLLSPASKWRMNDAYANETRLERQAGEAELILCAEDAKRRGIDDGSRVRVSTDIGSIELKAQVSDVVKPGTVLSYKGRWPRRESSGVNLNAIHACRPADMAQSTSVHGLMVRVVPA